jgi:plastocyanin
MGGESGILQTEETTAGEYAYYCTVHPYMTGTLKIQ